MQGTEKSRQRFRRKRSKRYDTGSVQVQVEFTQVAAVGFDRIDGETALHPEMAQISLGQRV
jgi:hypothetical protein